MNKAFIVDAVRTPIGRYAGALKDIRPDDLLAIVLRSLVERTGLPPSEIEDVIAGCSNQSGEDGRNVARTALLIAGFPPTVGGVTVNRLCGSGLEAVRLAFQTIASGEGNIIVAAGVESATRAPFIMPKPEVAFPRGELRLFDTTGGWRQVNPVLAEKYPPFSLGETAENVAEQERVAREVQDAYALESHLKAARAIKDGSFSDEIVPVEVRGPRGTAIRIEIDEHVNPGMTLDRLQGLRPAFRHGGTVTTGNSAAMGDGASAVLLTSAAAAERLGLQPMASVLASAVAGIDPAIMGLGIVPAARKAMQRAGVSPADIDLVELDEAFAAQALPAIREIGVAYDRVNVNGGSIALGHAVGSTGCRLVVTLVHEMHRRGARYGLAAMAVGMGQGLAVVLENASGSVTTASPADA